MTYFWSNFCLHLRSMISSPRPLCGTAVSWLSDHALYNMAWNVDTPPRITNLYTILSIVEVFWWSCCHLRISIQMVLYKFHCTRELKQILGFLTHWIPWNHLFSWLFTVDSNWLIDHDHAVTTVIKLTFSLLSCCSAYSWMHIVLNCM